MTVVVTMAALTLANAQTIFYSNGGEESAESHSEAAEKEGVQASFVCAELLGFIAPHLVPARTIPVS